MVLSSAIIVAGCQGEMNATVMDKGALEFEQISAEQWSRLANAQIFFGHQSVGGNLLEGINDVLREHPDIRLNIVQIDDAAQVNGPGLYHAHVGRNGEPSSKLAAFHNLVGAAGDSGIALLKYCYVDVTPESNAQELFDEYRQRIELIRSQHPDVKIVHVTLPLLTDAGTLRHWAAVVRKLPSGRQVNLIRQEYNELLRRTYAGKEPIFDLARLESTAQDGSPVTVRYKGQRVPVLADVWTYDGGHLNEAGRQQMAKAFLATLANVYDEVS
jgi:hypothetical protein